MRKNISSVALFIKHNNKESLEVSLKIKEKLLEKGINVIDSALVATADKVESSNEIMSVDLAISIGGDGTTLKTFRNLVKDIPVISINAGGTRGILSEASKDQALSIIDPILKGDYFLDSRLRLLACSAGKKFLPALNDYVFIRSDLTRTPLFTISIENNCISQRMDGLIISTPTGSTGHSLSNGGPIIHESLKTILITPLSSVNRMPSIVLPLANFKIVSNGETRLIIDGQQVHPIDEDQSTDISRFEYDATFLRLNKNKLRQLNKLGY